MQTVIRVSVDDDLLREAEALFADLGLTVDEGVRVFLRRSIIARGFPFPVKLPSSMEQADAEIQHFLKTGRGLEVYDTPEKAIEALDRM